MTSMTMFTQSLNSTKLYGFRANIEVIRIFSLSWTDLYEYLLGLLNNYEVKQILIWE